MLIRGVDRIRILKHFMEAQRRVAQGERCLARQRILIAKLKRDGHGTCTAQALLERMEESQMLQRVDLNRARAELREGIREYTG